MADSKKTRQTDKPDKDANLTVKLRKVDPDRIDWPEENWPMFTTVLGVPNIELLERLLLALPPILFETRNKRYRAVNNLESLVWIRNPWLLERNKPKRIRCLVVSDPLWSTEDWEQMQLHGIPLLRGLLSGDDKKEARSHLKRNARLAPLVSSIRKQTKAGLMVKRDESKRKAT